MISREQPRTGRPVALPKWQDSEAYLLLRNRLERALAAICPRELTADFDDLVQESMLRVMKQQEGKREFNASYLRKVAYCAMVDEIRRRRRRREESVEKAETATPIRSLSASPERTAAAREIGEAIRHCLQAMIADRRRAVTLYLQGHRVREVAELLGWGAKKAENFVFRGMADLRSCLQTKGVRP